MHVFEVWEEAEAEAWRGCEQSQSAGLNSGPSCGCGTVLTAARPTYVLFPFEIVLTTEEKEELKV